MPQDFAMTVRWILVHLTTEMARHAGHADIIRESIDGAISYQLNALADGQPWPPEGWSDEADARLGDSVVRRSDIGAVNRIRHGDSTSARCSDTGRVRAPRICRNTVLKFARGRTSHPVLT